MNALTVRDLVAGYEPGVPIVNGASLSIEAGEIVAVLGPNGAGKSTLIKAIAGIAPIASGAVYLGDEEITRLPAHRMVGRGLAFVPQTENVFTGMSARTTSGCGGDIVRRQARPAASPKSIVSFPISSGSGACSRAGCPADSARWRRSRARSSPRPEC